LTIAGGRRKGSTNVAANARLCRGTVAQPADHVYSCLIQSREPAGRAGSNRRATKSLLSSPAAVSALRSPDCAPGHGKAIPSEHTHGRRPVGGAPGQPAPPAPGESPRTYGRECRPSGWTPRPRRVQRRGRTPELRCAGPLVMATVMDRARLEVSRPRVLLSFLFVRRAGGCVCARGGADDLSSTMCCPRQTSRAPLLTPGVMLTTTSTSV
jgi:hypothetical protein